jgi:hypothetical protein
MITILVLVLLLIAFDLAAMRWGVTTSDGTDSKEWERRRKLQAAHRYN